MAITFASQLDAVSTTNQTVYTTASFTPASNKLQLVAISSLQNSGFTAAPTLSGNGITYTQINTVTLGTNLRFTLYCGADPSSSAGALTITHPSGQTECGWAIVEATGAANNGSDGSAAIMQSKTASVTAATSITATFNNPFSSTTAATWGAMFINSDTESVSNGTGYADTGFWTQALFGQCDTQGRGTNDTIADWSWVNSLNCCCIGVEIGAFVSVPVLRPAAQANLYRM